MGIGVPVLYLYHHLAQNSYFNNFKSVIELGSQDITVDRERISQPLEQLFGYTLTQETPVTAKTLYQSMGLELYQCIDADGRHNALTFDLNKDIKQAYGFAEQFDLVTNHGTTEHCFDQYRCFMNIHNLCAVGGLMIHVVPIQGYVNHGLYNYQPSFFYNLAAANHYKVINVYLSSYKSCDSLPYILPGLISYTETALKTLCNIGDPKPDIGLYVVLQKTIESSFSIPYDGQYLKVSLLKNEYSYQSGETANATPLKEESTEDSQEKLDSKIVEGTPLIENLIEQESDKLPKMQSHPTDNAQQMSDKNSSKEAQYQIQFDTLQEIGPVQMGPYASHSWRSDPRRLTFLLARYKFCSKILAGKSNVLEIGCSDGYGMRLLLQTVDFVHGVDFDPLFINWGTKHAQDEALNCKFSVVDITEQAPSGIYEAAYSLDLIEHIEPEKEHLYWENICKVLEPHGVFIVGTPNITASPYASEWSQEGHINLKSADSLKTAMQQYFHNVFIFSMNDEVVHTGFYPMAHYLLALGVGVR